MIPDKQFEGPRPTSEGRLEFNVTTGGNEHDIDDLSSGEKEILFGYLKIRARAPKNSVIIVDEPELHLNPRMIAGLPHLYEKHIGAALSNQVWLVTHSDMFLRRAFASGRMQVFHMDMPRDEDGRFNQMQHVGDEQRYERACLELIGDFATYEPQGRTILVEGGSKFDQEVVTRLFADDLRGVNVASVAGKGEVAKKKDELWQLQDIDEVRKEVVSIIDGDGVGTEVRKAGEANGEFRWDLYDIESYLLNAEYICQAVAQIRLQRPGDVPIRTVESLMQSMASEVHQEIVSGKIVDYVRRKLGREIRGNVRRPDNAREVTERDIGGLLKGARDAAKAMGQIAEGMTAAELKTVLAELRGEGVGSQGWNDGAWRKTVPGKRVLQKVAETLAGTGSALQLRNVIVGLMAKDGHKPEGMKKTLENALGYRRP